jgi:hypothetical protein
MNKNVVVLPNKNTGDILTYRTITDKATGEQREVGVVMVQQTKASGLSTIGRLSKRVAFITLEEEVLEFLGDSLQANQTFPVPGKLAILETTTPYVRKDGTTQEAKINPTTKDVITYQGSPVYRNTFFTEDMNLPDVFLRDVAGSTEGSNGTPE